MLVNYDVISSISGLKVSPSVSRHCQFQRYKSLLDAKNNEHKNFRLITKKKRSSPESLHEFPSLKLIPKKVFAKNKKSQEFFQYFLQKQNFLGWQLFIELDHCLGGI